MQLKSIWHDLRLKGRRLEAGFTLALSLFVMGVVVVLAAGLMARIVAELKGAQTSNIVSTMENEAEIGLKLAETEIFQGIDLLYRALWAGTMSHVIDYMANCYPVGVTPMPCPAAPNNACAPADDGLPGQEFPLRDLNVLGNIRNWPAFTDWSVYTSSPAYGGGYRSDQNPGAADARIGQNPIAPATKWNAADRMLTRGWWRVPRDNNPDNDYYGFNGSVNPTEVFPSAISGEAFVTGDTANTSYAGAINVPTLVHNYWYTKVMPIRGKKTPTVDSVIPPNTKWPNDEDEYGLGYDGTAGSNATASGAVSRYIWDTPFLKKVYRLPNGRKVIVYCRLDLRMYFAPSDPPPPPAENWLFTFAADRTNRLEFLLASVTEGRSEAIGGGQKKYVPTPLKVRRVTILTGGMRVGDLATIKHLLPPDDPVMAFIPPPPAAPICDTTQKYTHREDFQFPGTLDAQGGLLRASQDLRGIILRADGNRGFNFTSLATGEVYRYNPISPGAGTIKWSPIASERFVHLYEIVPPGPTGVTIAPLQSRVYYIYASYNPNQVNQNAFPSTAVPNQVWGKWTWRRRLMDTILEENDFSEPDSASGAPMLPLPFGGTEYQNSLWSSFSAVADANGLFTIPFASGAPADLGVPDPITGVSLYWRGPEDGRTYYTVNYPRTHRRTGWPFVGTGSALQSVR